jgi:hypothetical protein
MSYIIEGGYTIEPNPMTAFDVFILFNFWHTVCKTNLLGVTTNSHQQVGMLQNYPLRVSTPPPFLYT